ncbi:ASCH domain-containing protein [Sporolactobacillus sp. THM19-2]|uniref:ASCH domain-containing protein n=1 Tax=Sporolactobacillus sp. THM19-2 TaxID=2511171 RepID=UPI00101F78EE|nr:ASCH domain-containing protein [Sporolactobacillus sp. THM19-2]RYL92464.1 ASCH domain-containing protein [Sporolactobacillus sp. THM19-2]
MTNDKAIQAFWNDFKKRQGITHNNYQAWAFGNTPEMADKLADLVVKGLKTATTSARELYEKGEPLPQVGEFNMILDGSGDPVAMTRTVVVETVPYRLVTWEHAWHEGEGDRTLAYWRRVHEAFFKQEYAEAGRTFTENIPCVCEVFEWVQTKHD